MKKTAAIPVMAVQCVFVSAQMWEGNATGNIYYNTGNVGIGNSHPEHTLDITGDMNVTGYLKVGERSIIGNNDHQFTIGITPGDGIMPTVLKIVPSGSVNMPDNPYP